MGGENKHKFNEVVNWSDNAKDKTLPFEQITKQEALARTLAGKFQKTRIVIRYGDHPLIRELYPASIWTWHEVTGRTTGNNAKAEVLITRNI